MESLFALEPSPYQRILILWAFVVLGLVLAVQISQTQADEPLQWTRLTKQSKPYWITLYVLEVFLLVQNTYPLLLDIMEPYFNGYEERILNTVWVGLLAVEVLMVLGVAVQGAIKRFAPQPKQKTT